MADYIEREALLKELQNPRLFNVTPKILEIVQEAPTADVAEVRREKWDDSGRYEFPGGSKAIVCSGCGCALTAGEYRMNTWNYCPVCGARMDGGAGK